MLSLPNVLVTGHQGFLTAEALAQIAITTIDNIDAFERVGRPVHAVTVAYAAAGATSQGSGRTPELTR